MYNWTEPKSIYDLLVKFKLDVYSLWISGLDIRLTEPAKY